MVNQTCYEACLSRASIGKPRDISQLPPACPPWRVFRPNVPTRLQPSFVLNRFRTRLCGSSAHGVYLDQVEPSRPWIFLSSFNFQLSTVNSLARHRPADLFGWPSNPHAILFTLVQFSRAPRQKMVWLWLPIELSAPGTRAVNKPDRRRTHGTDRNATRAPLGPPLLETRPWQRRRLHLSRPDPRSCGRRSDPFPDSKPQSRRHDGTEHRSRRPRHHRLLPSHACPQDRQDQQVRRAIPDFLGHLQRLRPPCELGRVSSPAPLRHGHARRHFQSEARRLLVGASSLALSNAPPRQTSLGA